MTTSEQELTISAARFWETIMASARRAWICRARPDRINTPVIIEGGPGGFSFNQYLVVDDEPLIFHTGPRKMFPLVREAVASVLPVEHLRYVALSHVEADECGSLNEWLAAAPQSSPLCGTVAAMVSINDLADRPARALADGEVLSLGKHSMRWFDTPHLPHAWECGFLMEERTRTLLCGDLFTQGGADLPALTESDILGPSEAFRHGMDYFSHTKNARLSLRAAHAVRPPPQPATTRGQRTRAPLTPFDCPGIGEPNGNAESARGAASSPDT